MDRSPEESSMTASPVQPSSRDALLEAEARQLAHERSDPASPYFTGDPKARVDRRRFLVGSLAAAGAAGVVPRSARSSTRCRPTRPHTRKS